MRTINFSFISILLILVAVIAHAQRKPTTLLYDENEELREKRSDTNSDGTFDEFVYYQSGSPSRAVRDTDHDGTADLW
ncbi:hypothetical protein MK292_10395, partial [Myxococcota bacterium]|nr:hypothetical protein [Myxococcota bacterium]